MFAALLISVFATAYVAAKIPPYIHMCDYKDPKFEQCIADNVGIAINKSCSFQGIPELDIPPLNSWRDELIIIDSPTLKLSFLNLDVFGLCTYNVKRVSYDKNHVDMEILYQKFTLNGTYDFGVRILVPIQYKGDIYANIENVGAKFGLDMKIVTNRGKKYIYVSKINVNLDFKDYDAIYNVKNAELHQLQEIIDSFIGNKEEIIKALKPAFEKKLAQRFLYLINDLLKHLSYEEL